MITPHPLSTLHTRDLGGEVRSKSAKWGRSRRRTIEATAFAAIFSGAPSTAHALVTGRDVRSVVDYLTGATRAIGVLVPPGKPGIARGALAHTVISIAAGELLSYALPQRHSIAWGAAAGLAMGIVNVGVIGRRFPSIRALPLAPQLADNVAFGAMFAAVADRR